MSTSSSPAAVGEVEPNSSSLEAYPPTLTVESEEEEEEEGGGGVGQLLRTTVDDLEAALQESRQLLATRDLELVQHKQELERYKQQAAREIANKTRLAQALDQSQSHVAQLEELLQNWQLQLQEFKVQEERLQSAVQAEQVKNIELENRLVLRQEQEDALRGELDKLQHKGGSPWERQTSLDSGAGAIDGAQQLFLKQAVFHLLTDFHAEEQLRAIISILDFSAQDRKAVYAKLQEKGGLYK